MHPYRSIRRGIGVFIAKEDGVKVFSVPIGNGAYVVDIDIDIVCDGVRQCYDKGVPKYYEAAHVRSSVPHPKAGFEKHCVLNPMNNPMA